MAESTDDAAKAQPETTPASQTPTQPATATIPAESHENAPDPDEDDLDDLDDMLDEFSISAKPAAPAPVSSNPVQPAAASQPDAPSSSSGPEIPGDFAAELQKEMEALMGTIDSSPDMQKQMEAMMAELSTADAPAAEASTSTATDNAKPGGDDAFSETIRKTMERMQASSSSASAAANSAAASEDDMFAALMKEMAAGGADGGDGSEEDFSKMLLGMMEQLTNKEILYEPMKDLDTRFPQWMKENEGKVGEEDWKRYGEQRRIVRDIVGRFETTGYSDENPKDREFIVERMQEMQAQGSPPNDLVGDMKETQEALGEIDNGCPQQ